MFAPLRKPAAPKSPRPATACRDASPRHLHIRTVSRRTGRRSGRRRKGQTGTVTTAASTAGNATTTVAHGTSFGSLRRAAASGADAIPPNSSSRSIEVHRRKQAPFYPRALAATRKVDGRRAVHRARGARRDGEGERVVRAPLSRALSLSLALSRRYSPSLSLSLALALPRTPLLRIPDASSRIAAPYVRSPEEFTRGQFRASHGRIYDVRRALELFTTFTLQTICFTAK